MGPPLASTAEKITPVTPLSDDHHEESIGEMEEFHHDDANDNGTRGLLSKRKKRVSFFTQPTSRSDWKRPYWLGFGLFLTLFAFWLLDSLKDPVFALLVDGNLNRHQPPAKLCSVASTLLLVCFLEFVSHARKQQQEKRRNDDDILSGGGTWTSMSIDTTSPSSSDTVTNDRVSTSIFAYVGGSYICIFSLLAYLLHFHPSEMNDSSLSARPWHVLGYILYATIESFGSLSVAAFWSYTNSTLSLDDAERFYGLIIAIAQLGAIGGSSMVTTDAHYWSTTTLMIVANLVIVLQILVMVTYSKRFAPTANMAQQEQQESLSSEDEPVFWSGIYLILRHRYVMLILGVSCLYEVSLTCLDYQMKLLGWFKFEETSSSSISFTQFMGHYGQVVNGASLVFSYFLFPYLIRKYGLRMTLRLFPTLLVLATVLAFAAIPGNLAVLFVCMAILKAMTYSIHDPSKELLYLPTSLAIKFRSKFWIDVVGARVAKAVGSTINSFAGNVEGSIRVGTVPSLLTAAALWLVCYRAGIMFDRLVASDKIVGVNTTDAPPIKTVAKKYKTLSADEHDNDDDIEDVQHGLTAGELNDSADGSGEENIELRPLM
jgi:AAA family ATP:ADP antiporter